MKVYLVLFILLTSGCSTKFLTKKDYHQSVVALKANDPVLALKYFPDKEKGGFITTMEKTYLSLLTGNPDIDALQKFSSIIYQRVRFDLSREVSSFFYAETPDGYYASEHEIVWMHLLLSWGYSQRKEPEKACVEARKASFLLSYEWSDEGVFDDAVSRSFLAAMWYLCGDWEEARVDFRRASLLQNNLAWMQELSSLDAPPENLVMGLGGVGAEPYWKSEATEGMVEGLRNIGFKMDAERSVLTLKDKYAGEITMYQTLNSDYWYQRHLQRDNAIYELVKDSQYATEAVLASSRETLKTASAVTYAVTAGVLMTSAGIAILQGGNGFELGLALTLFGPSYAYKTVKKSYNDSVNDLKESLDTSDGYRFVRFLPQFLWFGWSEKKLPLPFDVIKNNNAIQSYSDSESLVVFLESDVKSNTKENEWILPEDRETFWGKTVLKELLDPSVLTSINERVNNRITREIGFINKKTIRERLYAEGYFSGHYFSLEIKADNLILELQRGIFSRDEEIVIDLINHKITIYSGSDSALFEISPNEVVTIIKTLLTKV
ncbi:MAG: hypothetical protein OEY29_15745 [Gammaproteobacteria bacterium]|nr:hypothetical protein [Gammaproteobacteria bacterium]